MDCGDTGGEPAFSAEKTKNRSQKERNREENYGHCFSFVKFYSVQFSSVAQSCLTLVTP